MACPPVARPRRIIDYLNDGEELGVEGPAAPGTPSPRSRSVLPRFGWARLVRLGRKGGDSGEGKGKEVAVVVEELEEEDVVAVERDDPAMAASTSAACAVRESTTTTTTAAGGSGTMHPDVCLGLSLVFLRAKTSDEFNKMAKVRAEMEALLKEFKHRRDGIKGEEELKPGNPDSATSSCVTDRNEQGGSGRHLVLEDRTASSAVETASGEKSTPSDDDGCRRRTDVLEEELDAELEMLEVNYGSETPSCLQPEEEDEHGSDSDPYDDDDDEVTNYRHGVQDDEDEQGEVAEVEDEEDYDDDETTFNGVSAVELERRLHELLDQRNRDRIAQLEAALRSAEKKLAEKEMEVCLWKDTAKFALRQSNELQ